MVIRFQLQRVGDCGVCGNTGIPLYFQPEPAMRQDRGKVWCIWCWKRHYGIGVHISGSDGGVPHAEQVSFSIHDDDWAQVVRALEHPLFPSPLDEPSGADSRSLAERMADASDVLCTPARDYVMEQRQRKWAEIVVAHHAGTYRPQVYHYPSDTGMAAKPASEMTQHDLVVWERMWAIAAGAIQNTPVIHYDLARYCDGQEPPTLEVYDDSLRTLVTTALSLVLRMARGYDWTPAEVDAFEAACREAGIVAEGTAENLRSLIRGNKVG